MSRQRGPGFLAGALFGGVLGGALGVLFAPRSGRETRRELRERGAAARSSNGSEPELGTVALAAGVVAGARERLEAALAEARAAAAEARGRLADEWAARKAGREPSG